MLFIASLLAFNTACSDNKSSSEKNSLRTYQDMLDSGTLKILTRNAPTTWYINAEGDSAGLDHDLGKAYSHALGLTPEFIVKDSIGEIFEALAEGEADVAAAGLTVLPSRKEQFLLGPAYDAVHQVLVCRRDREKIKDFNELEHVDITVVADSSYVERLKHLQQTEYPELTWKETDNYSTEELLARVEKGKVDCTIADSTIFKINRRYLPELEVMLQISASQDIALYLPNHRNKLHAELHAWFNDFDGSARQKKITDRYYGYFREFDYVDVSVLTRRIEKRFKHYKRYFQVAAERYDIAFHTLAAQSYQESHWDPDAVSPTGVKGMMMLTRNTAESVNVMDRTDAKQSIMGGANYLNKMMQSFKSDVSADDRLYLALAAYNIGRGHMHDAQTLARKQGLSPYHWHDMKRVLPLLSQKKYYSKLKYGYARGTEPVKYVQRIREYQHILENHLN